MVDCPALGPGRFNNDTLYVLPHTPMKYNEWPTLGEKIDSGKRIVLFLEYAANTTQVDIILPEFDIVRLRQHECTLSPYMCTYQPNRNLAHA